MSVRNSPWELHIREEDGAERVIELHKASYLIGRSEDAEVVLDRPSVSRRHALLRINEQGQWFIADQGSRMGTFVNQQKIDSIRLNSGDVIGISRFVLRLVDRQESGWKQVRGRMRSEWGSETPDSQISVLTKIASPRLDMSQITAITEFGRRLMTVESAEARLQQLCELITGEMVRARWVMVLRLDEQEVSRPPEQLAIHPPQATEREDLHLSRTTIAAMRQSGAPVLASNFGNDKNAVEMSIVSKAPATAVVACPLGDEQDSRDLVYVNLPPVFGSTEWLALIALAVKQYQQAQMLWRMREAMQMQIAMEQELRHARQIQQSILPARLEVEGWQLAWHYEPCESIGGDFVDVLRMPDGRILLAIADVSGHGLPAALATLAVHSIVRTCIKGGLTLTQMMQRLNEHLCEHLPTGRFVTMTALCVNTRSGELECINAGHLPPLVFAHEGHVRELQQAEYFPLGIAPEEYISQHEQLQSGEMLALLTDGLTEIQLQGGEMVGSTGVNQFIQQVRSREPSDLNQVAHLLSTQLQRWRGEHAQLDDQTFLLARRN